MRYYHISDETVVRSEDFVAVSGEMIIIDFDADDRIVGVEILDGSRPILPKPAQDNAPLEFGGQRHQP